MTLSSFPPNREAGRWKERHLLKLLLRHGSLGIKHSACESTKSFHWENESESRTEHLKNMHNEVPLLYPESLLEILTNEVWHGVRWQCFFKKTHGQSDAQLCLKITGVA